MISNKAFLDVEIERTAHCLRVRSLVYEAFEQLCERHGFQRVNEVLEKMMLRCVLNEGLFLLVTYGQLHPTVKRRKKKQAARELEEKLRELAGLDENKPTDLQGRVDRLKRRVEELRQKRLMSSS